MKWWCWCIGAVLLAGCGEHSSSYYPVAVHDTTIVEVTPPPTCIDKCWEKCKNASKPADCMEECIDEKCVKHDGDDD